MQKNLMKKTITLLSTLLFLYNLSLSNTRLDSLKIEKEKKIIKILDRVSKFRLNGFGNINYNNYDLGSFKINGGNAQGKSIKPSSFEAEFFNLYLSYIFNNKWEVRTEIEFEYGGTGVTTEFDVLEEFGEFETEIEQGGEVVLEQMNLLYKFKPWLRFRFGKIKLYMGLGSRNDDPLEKLSPRDIEAEIQLIPVSWYEYGLETSGDLKWFKNKNNFIRYRFAVINGLNSEEFSGLNWVVRGNFEKFEEKNAGDFAVQTRIDFVNPTKRFEYGFSGYAGNTTKNRSKLDLEEQARVFIGDFHLMYNKNPYRLRFNLMYGHLTNSEIISKRNKQLSNALNAKRTAVGQAIYSYYVEFGIDVLKLQNKKNKLGLIPFVRYEKFDSQHETEGVIQKNIKSERELISGGLNFYPLQNNIVFKSFYTHKTFGDGVVDKTISLSVGYKF